MSAALNEQGIILLAQAVLRRAGTEFQYGALTSQELRDWIASDDFLFWTELGYGREFERDDFLYLLRREKIFEDGCKEEGTYG